MGSIFVVITQETATCRFSVSDRIWTMCSIPLQDMRNSETVKALEWVSKNRETIG